MTTWAAERMFWGDETILYVDCSDGYMTAYVRTHRTVDPKK